MNDKIVNGLFGLGIVTLIGVMSWRDMHPAVISNDANWVQNEISYYAGGNIAAGMIPDDSKPVTINVGTFNYGAGGKLAWAPHGMPAATFAQRQINLQFDFSSLPKDPAATIKKIKAVSEEWVHKGDAVNVLILNDTEPKVDVAAYDALNKVVYETFRRTHSFIIYDGINVAWPEATLKTLQQNSSQFVVQLPEIHIAPELFARLKVIKYNLVLRYPVGAMANDLDVAMLKKLSNLSGVELTLDANKPLPKKEDAVGLFPKF